MSLKDLGEFGLIDLFRRAAKPARSEVRQGIGDDCAVLAWGQEERLLVTTDMLLEEVHFRREWLSPAQIGWKSLAVSLSDIAAMGGEPTGAFLALGLPVGFPLEDVEGLREGFMACADAFGVDLLGGDTVASPAGLILCVTAIGKAAHPVLRSTARPGDVLFLGGPVGGAAAGLHLLRSGTKGLEPSDRMALLTAHQEPRPQVDLGLLLARSGLATAMIDVSDGVLQDLGHICSASGLGAVLDPGALPIPSPARRLGALASLDPVEWGISGGEDYCLLFCVSPDRCREACEAVLAQADMEIIRVGEMLEEVGPPRLLGRPDDESLRGGFDHFASSS